MNAEPCLVDSSFTNKSVGTAMSLPVWLNQTKKESNDVVKYENNRGIVSGMHSIANYVISPDRIEDEFRKTLKTTWYIKNILPADAKFVVIFGEPKTCKSFVTLDMVLSIAIGIDYHGYKTKQANVLYVAAEGQNGILKRIIGWKKEREIQDLVGFTLYPKRIILDNDPEAQDLIGYIRSPDSNKPEIIVIDTLARCINGDENNEGMQALVANVTNIIAETGAVVILIHHTPKCGKQMRGHGCLNGAVDLSYLLERINQNNKNSEDILIKMSAASVKDHADGVTLSFVMNTIDTECVDSDGNQITTLIPEIKNVSFDEYKKLPVLAGKNKYAYYALKEAIRKSGSKGVGFQKWLDEWRLQGLSDANDKNLYYRKSQLISKGYIKENQGLFYIHIDIDGSG